MTTRIKETKKLLFPSVHLSMHEHLILEESWKDFAKHEAETGAEGMTDLITSGAKLALEPTLGDDGEEIQVPSGVDLNTVALLQAIGLQMRIMGDVCIVEPKDFVTKVWRISRLYYRELLRLSGVKPEGS